jgi:heat-inducible transcriptional repressor
MEDHEVLGQRETRVLDAIVRNYVLTASPTGSRFLAKQQGFNCSAATLRNVMGDLEERGYISHPHTSAGRIPTDKGYRYYVDRLMSAYPLPRSVRQQIRDTLRQANPTDLHMLMDVTSRTLSKATDQLGVILAPPLRRGVFRHVDICETSAHRYVVNITLESGFVKAMSAELQTEIPQRRLQDACQTLNERFYGLALEDMCRVGEEPFTDVGSYELGVLRLFIPSIRRMMEEDASSDRLVTEGTVNILMKPEFANQIGAIVEILEEKKLLMHLFDAPDEDEGRVRISIGGEIEGGQFSSFSMVKARYKVGNLEGTLGAIGPKRMRYPLLVAAVDYTAKTLSQLHAGDEDERR